MNTITRNTVVTLDYAVTDIDGNVVDAGTEPLEYLHGSHQGIFLAIERALEGKKVGDTLTLKLQPAEAFGEYDPDLIDIVPVAELPQPLTVGMQIEGTIVDGGEDERLFSTVTDIADGKAVLDGNHPLAGMSLLFSCTVVDVRRASADELEAALKRGAEN